MVKGSKMNFFESFVLKLLQEDISRKYRFTIHEHHAKRAGVHYDVRIENPKGNVDSWACRKGVPIEPGVKVLVIKQPEHKIDWLDYEGEYEGDKPGTYGAGKLIVWDKGECHRIYETKENLIIEIIHSSKLKGKYVFHKMKEYDWILFKMK